METNSPPLRIINIGKTYRRQADISHSPMFHQFEGLVIDKNIDRYKEDILSDIRAVTGVTIINTEQHRNVKNLDYNIVLMKIDTGPYSSPDPDVPTNILDSLLRIRKQLLKVPGILRIKYLTKPEKLA